MKKLLLTALGIVTLSSSVALAAPQDKLDVSLQQWNIDGSFDYYLHYQGSSQLLSQVSLPQNQNMSIFSMKYHADDVNYIKFQYGSTSSGNKGTGSDSDWTTQGSNTKTDYGNMDPNGNQKMITLDFGTTISQTNKDKTSIFTGWGRRDTNNQLTNVIYHLEDGVDIGNVSQPNNGSSLNATFQGVHIGIENEHNFNEKLVLISGLSASYLNAKAYGDWENHSPAWTWTDAGNTLGCDMNIGLKYSLNKNTTTELGYYYSYAKMTGGNEVLNQNNGEIDNLSGIDLGYTQRGYYFGLSSKF